MEQEIKELRAMIQQAGILFAQFQEQVKNLSAELNRQKSYLEKLAAVSNLEWSQDANDWADREKLKALKGKPRS